MTHFKGRNGMTILTIGLTNSFVNPLSQEQDDYLRLQVIDRLHASGYLLLRKVQCDVADGIVTLSGSVPSFHLKQVAQAVLVKIEDVRGVRNLIEVL